MLCDISRLFKTNRDRNQVIKFLGYAVNQGRTGGGKTATKHTQRLRLIHDVSVCAAAS